MKKEKIDMVIETFTDYVEHYYEENMKPTDVSTIVNNHFEEFARWAYDDFVITKEERDTLLNPGEVELQNKIKQIVISEFLSILNNH